MVQDSSRSWWDRATGRYASVNPSPDPLPGISHNSENAVDRAVQATREAVFPQHGLNVHID